MIAINNRIQHKKCVVGADKHRQFPIDPCVFTQTKISEIIELPCQLPDIQSIIKVDAKDVEVFSTRVIETPCGESLSNFKLTGKKVVVQGDLDIHVTYSSPCGLNLLEHVLMFNEFIVAPASWDMNKPIFATVLLEDVFAVQLDPRKLQINVLLFIHLQGLEPEPCPPKPCPPPCPPPCPQPCPPVCPTAKAKANADSNCITMISIDNKAFHVPSKKRRRPKKAIKHLWG